ncbi:MAG: hypothetical protein L6R41_006117 [Letrouitia leprolyta]|nr:MAG: hypothetical protein L6R41_006117 [Letrouitia leprolyta]
MVEPGLWVDVAPNEQAPSVLDTRHQGCTDTKVLASFAQSEMKNLTPPSVPEQELGGPDAGTEGSAQSPLSEGVPSFTITPTAPLKYDLSTQRSGGRSFEQPAASSLVSPPASSHDESEQPASAAESRLLYSGSSSRHSSRHPMQVQRFTPESGPARRDSSSSVVADTATAEAVKSPRTSPLSVHAPDSTQKRMRARLGSEIEADEESLKLIKALQAEDYGLRRRGRIQ